MRDPLRNVSVRFKLAITFVGVCLLAFGVGGFAVSRSAMGALESEILTRLEFETEVSARALDAAMRALDQRARDFASDGYIRTRLEAIHDAQTDVERAAAAEELRVHLRLNKLPLVPAFTNLIVADAEGDHLVGALEGEPAWVRSVLARGSTGDGWCSGLFPAPTVGAPPALVLATPLRSLQGTRRIGTLYVELHPGIWVLEAMGEIRSGDPDERTRPALKLIDPRGRTLGIPPGLIAHPLPEVDAELVLSGFGLTPGPPVPESEDAYSPIRGILRRRIPIPSNGWSVELELESGAALAAVSGLQMRFLVVGLVLAAIACVFLFFPMRFLARPLIELREASRRIEAGEFSVRVEVGSTDEIGALASSFNRMAGAVEERTSRLERSAADLQLRQHELRAERDRLNAVISSMRDGLVVLDPDGRPVVWNAAAGPLVEMVRGGRLEPTSHRVCRESSPIDAAHAEAGSNGASENCRRCLFDPQAPPRSCVVDVEHSVFEIHSTRLAPGTDGRSGRVLVSRDISDRVGQDEREIHQERLAVLGEVAAVVAHELNNPLAAIMMFNQMLEADLPQDSPLRESVSVIERNAQTCKRTIRELLDYATGSSPEVGEVDVHEMLEDVARFLRPLRERQGVELALELEPRELLVRSDEVQIRQIFVNLIMNALQAVEGRGGRVLVSTRVEGDHVLVDVHDDGPGVPTELLDKVFKPFFTTKARGSGTGLGLSTARRIAEMQGGGLDLISSAPGDTLFRVRLLTSQNP